MTTNKNDPEKLELIQLEGDPPTSNSRQQLGDLLYEEICYALKEGFIGEIRVSPPHECRLSDEDEDCCCESWAGFFTAATITDHSAAFTWNSMARLA